MKNNIIKLSLVVVVTLLSFGCNNEFLERAPLDEISNESFWNSENDLLVYNNGLYNIARNEDNVPILMGHDEGFDSQSRGMWYHDGFADNTSPRHDRGLRFQVVRAGKHTIPNTPEWFGYKGWNFLNAINFGLENFDKVPVDEDVRNKYIGEARLLRGWFYADKVNKFGEVQWVDKVLTLADEDVLYGSRDSRDLVMGHVLEDLNFATQNIPNSWGDGHAPGRIDRWGALAVKARICLFEGTWRKYHGLSDANTWLQASADAALELMTDGPYSLYISGDPATAYNELHRLKDLSGNPEVIYWRRYELGFFTNHVQNYHKGYVGGATKSAVEDYLCTDGLPITLSPLYQGDEVYTDIFVDRDPRLRQTILHPDDQAIYNYGNHASTINRYPRIQGMGGGQSSTTGYHIIKVFESVAAYAAYNVSATPAIVLRFGEVLLNYAEAKAELGTITQGDLDMSINLLRDRVGMPHMTTTPQMDPRYAGDGVSALISEIRRERRVELFMEGFRYDDLRRWKQGKKLEVKDYGMRWDAANKAAMDGSTANVSIGSSLVDGIEYLEVYKGTSFENPVFDEGKHYLWPLPISVISQNPNLGQNPGWDE